MTPEEFKQLQQRLAASENAFGRSQSGVES